MHHRRRSRRRDRRSMLPCGCCEDIRGGKGAPQIEENEICMGKAKKRKPRPKKTKCPAGGPHEWYREWTEEKDFERDLLDNCQTCKALREKWIAERERWKRLYGWEYSLWQCPYRVTWCVLHGEKRYFTRRRKIATCINCWETRVEKVTDNFAELFPYEATHKWLLARRRLVLPKRPVKLY